MKNYTVILACAAAVMGLFQASGVEAASRFEIKQMVVREAAASDVPVELALAVAKVESDFNAKALSSAGARGVMQIMPATARGEFGVAPDRLWEPKLNIRLGVQFLEQLYDQYDGRWDLALSHYNGGTIKGNRPHSYTQGYLKRVQKWQRVYGEQASLWVERKPDPDVEYSEGRDYADLREWRSFRDDEDWAEPGSSYEWALDDFSETRIIVVEREAERGWRRPPPPRNWRDHGPRPGRWGAPPPPRGGRFY